MHPRGAAMEQLSPEQLSPEQLRKEQINTLTSPPLRYGLFANVLFLVMDILYGKTRTWNKFKVLELIARVPYQAWEHVAYIAITHSYHESEFVRRIYDRIREARHQQDNEQWHLLLLEEWIHRHHIREGFFRYRLMPQLIAFMYYHISWLLYVIKPSWSYRLNMEFEDHAEREYMKFVEEHPEFEYEPFQSCFKMDYGNFEMMADVLRQIGYDERMHKKDSLAKIEQARFT